MSTNKSKFTLQKLSGSLILAVLLFSAFALISQVETSKADTLTFGQGNQFPSTDSVSGGGVIGYSASPSATGNVTFIHAYLSASAANVTACIYSDSSGPNTLLASSTTVLVQSSGWIDFPMNYQVTGGTTYWLCLYSVNTFTYTWNRISGLGNVFAYGQSATPTSPNPPSTFPFSGFYGQYLGIYATYVTPESTPGPSSPATTPTPTPVHTATPAPTTPPTVAPTTVVTPAPTVAPTETSTTAPTETPVITEAPTAAPTATPTSAATETPAATTAPSEGFPTYLYAVIGVIVIVVVALAVVMMMRRKK
jgi:hypothetical protein